MSTEMRGHGFESRARLWNMTAVLGVFAAAVALAQSADPREPIAAAAAHAAFRLLLDVGRLALFGRAGVDGAVELVGG
jgi:hypothetical protein